MTPEDEKLWKDYAHDIQKLQRGPEISPPSVPTAGRTRSKPAAAPVPAQKSLSIGVAAQPSQLDGRTDQRLRRGKIAIDGTLDLHGHTQAQAHKKLNDFLLRAHNGGKRCVLVITGKGRQTPERAVGVLKEKLPLWISLAPLCDIVLKFYPAAIKDGGSGAWYVYLKRNRNN